MLLFMASALVAQDPPTVVTPVTAVANPVVTTSVGLTALGADDGGANALRYIWSVVGTPPAAVTFTSSGSNSSKSTTARFTAIGTYTIRCAITDAGNLAVNSQLVVTVSPKETSVTIAPTTVAINLLATQAFTATVKDQFGAVMSTPSAPAWTISSGRSGALNATTGVFTANTTSGGYYQVRATSGGAQGTALLSVVNRAPVVATVATASPAVVTAKTTNLTVLGADDAVETSLTYTWATVGVVPAAVTFSTNGNNTAKSVTATFAKAGTYALACTIRDAGGLVATSSVNVAVTALPTTVTVSPATVTVAPRATSAFTASVKDQFGIDIVPIPALTWALASTTQGTISTTGLFTASNLPGGPVVVSAATATPVVTGTARVTVGNAPPTIVVAANTPAQPVTTTSCRLSALGADEAGEAGLIYTWSTTGTPPAPVTWSANATNAAKSVTATFTKPGVYALRVAMQDAGGATTTSALSVTVAAEPTTLTVAPTTATINLLGSQAFTASVVDQFGSPILPAPTVGWSTTTTASGTVAANGVFTATTTSGAGIGVVATVGATRAIARLTVANATPTVTTAATAARATPTTAALAVLGADDAGEAALTYSWSVTGTPPAPVAFSHNGTNAAKAVTATFTKPGSYGFLVTLRDAGGLVATSAATLTVSAEPALLAVSPSTATGVQGFTTSFVATATDQFGGSMPTPALTWTVADPLRGTVSTTGAFTATLVVGGPVAVRAVVTAAPTVMASATVTTTNTLPTVAMPITLQVPEPITTTTARLTVLGADDGGATALLYGWSVAGTPPAPVTFSATGTNAAKSTTATFTAPGSYTLVATITDAQGAQVTTSRTLQVQATPTSILVAPASATVAVTRTATFTAVVRDQFTTPLATQPTITWGLGTGAAGTISTGGVFTASSATGGAWAVTATAGTLIGRSRVTVGTGTNVAPTVATVATPAATTVLGTSVGLTVLGADDAGEPALTYTWSTTGQVPAPVTFSANGTNAAKAATATFTALGSYGLLCTIRDAAGLTVTSAASVTVSPNATQITVTPASSSTIQGGIVANTLVVRDQFLQVMTPPAMTWSVTPTTAGAINGAGVFTAARTPTAAVTLKAAVTATPTTAGTANVAVGNQTPTWSQAPTATATPTTVKLAALGADDAGEPALIYTWSTTGTPPAPATFSANGTNAARATTATLTKGGSYVFQVVARDAQGATTTASVTVSVPVVATSMVVSPATATLNVTKTQAFTASVLDQFAVALAPQPTITWSQAGPSLGTMASTGIFTAGTTDGGPVLIIAQSGAISGTARISVTNAAPTIATAAAAGAWSGATVPLTVLGADDGPESALTYTWSAGAMAPAPVTFSANGTNAAKSVTATLTKAGSYPLTVTIRDPKGALVSANLTLAATAAPTTMTLTPATITVSPNASQLFTVTVADQFQQPLLPTPSLTWSLSTATQGTISTAGLFRASTTPGGPITVRAQAANGAVATASLTVANTAPTITFPATAEQTSITTTTTKLSVLATDDGGDSAITYRWVTVGTPPAPVVFSAVDTNAAKNVTATFTKLGTYTIEAQARDAQGAMAASRVTVTVTANPTTMTISPTAVTIGQLASQVFTATVKDQFGAALTPTTDLVWAVSTTTSGALAPAASPGLSATFTSTNTPGGPFLVTAKSSSATGTALITVLNQVPRVVTAATATLNPDQKTINLGIVGGDDGDPTTMTYSWETTGTSPTGAVYSVNRTTASASTLATVSKPGPYTFTCSIKDVSGLMSSGSVNVVVAPVQSSIVVTPNSVVVNPDTSRQFTASAKDQFGVSLSPQPTFAWSVPIGAGTVSSAGNFRAAGQFGGPYPLTASAGSTIGSAQVTVGGLRWIQHATGTPEPFSSGQRWSLSAQADNALGSSMTYTWGVTRGDPNGLSINTVGSVTGAVASIPGVYTLRCTATSGSISITSDVVLDCRGLIFTGAPVISGALLQAPPVAVPVDRDAWPNGVTYTWSSSNPNVFLHGVNGPNGSQGAGYLKVLTSKSEWIYDCVITCVATHPTWPAAKATVSFVWSGLTEAGTFGFAPVPASNLGDRIEARPFFYDMGFEDSEVTVTWSVLSGPAPATFLPATTIGSAPTTIQFSMSGVYEILMSATSPLGALRAVETVNVRGVSFVNGPGETPSFRGANKVEVMALATSPMGPESLISYTWTATGPAPVVFSVNGSNAAKTSVAQFGQVGTYEISCRAQIGNWWESSKFTVVVQTLRFAQGPGPASGTAITDQGVFFARAEAFGGTSEAIAYTWSMIYGAAPVTYSSNGSPAAHQTDIRFYSSGYYLMACTAHLPTGEFRTQEFACSVVRPNASPVAAAPAIGTAPLLIHLNATALAQGLVPTSVIWRCYELGELGRGVSLSTTITTPGTYRIDCEVRTSSVVRNGSVVVRVFGDPVRLITGVSQVPPLATDPNKILVVSGFGSVARPVGELQFKGIHVIDGGVLTHDHSLLIKTQNDVVVDVRSAILAESIPGGYGNGPEPLRGGSHGGIGFNETALNVFDSWFWPQEGGGTGTNYRGGGVISMTLGGSLINHGRIGANGAGPNYGGAGGSIAISAQDVEGTGRIEVRGSLHGGGGRMAIWSDMQPDESLRLNASGGAGGTTGGTIFVRVPRSAGRGKLIVDQSDALSAGKTPLSWKLPFNQNVPSLGLKSPVLLTLESWGAGVWDLPRDLSVYDADDDGALDWEEIAAGSNPHSPDSDGDGLGDGQELGLPATRWDPDGDQVPSWKERLQDSDPAVADTDWDGVPDGSDGYPRDPARSQRPIPSPTDATAPIITVIRPANAVKL